MIVVAPYLEWVRLGQLIHEGRGIWVWYSVLVRPPDGCQHGRVYTVSFN